MLKLRIDFVSLFNKGTKKIKDDFIVCLITGYQGTGKTYFAVYNAEKYLKQPTIYTNIQTYHSAKHKIQYFKQIEEIYSIPDKNAIFIIDEISKKYTKNSLQDKDFYAWLQQSRKHNRYVYLITQEYIQVPTWLRGVANKIYTTKKFGFLFKTDVGYPVLDKETMDWNIDVYGSYIYKRNKKYSDLYDTFEYINSL